MRQELIKKYSNTIEGSGLIARIKITKALYELTKSQSEYWDMERWLAEKEFKDKINEMICLYDDKQCGIIYLSQGGKL